MRGVYLGQGFGLLAAIEAAVRRREWQTAGNREVHQVVLANKYRAEALAGGGSREVARRARQIAAGRLKVTA